jgi:hypothetical protein
MESIIKAPTILNIGTRGNRVVIFRHGAFHRLEGIVSCTIRIDVFFFTLSLNLNKTLLLCFWTICIVLFFLFKTTFRRLDSICVFRWNLLSLAQSIELLPISGHQHQHKIGYINQPQHNISARVKTIMKNIKRTAHAWCLAPMSMHYLRVSVYKINGLSEYKPSLKTNSLYNTNIKTLISRINYTGGSCNFLTSAAIMGVQMWDMSKLGWLIGWSTKDNWVEFLVFPVGGVRFNLQDLRLLHMHVGLILIFQTDLKSGCICAP